MIIPNLMAGARRGAAVVPVGWRRGAGLTPAVAPWPWLPSTFGFGGYRGPLSSCWPEDMGGAYVEYTDAGCAIVEGPSGYGGGGRRIPCPCNSIECWGGLLVCIGIMDP